MLSSQACLFRSLLLACLLGTACASNTPSRGMGETGGEGGGGGTEATGGKTGGTGGRATAGSGGTATGGGGGSATGGATGGSGGTDDDAGAGQSDAAPPAGDGPGPLPGGMKVVYVLHEANPGGSANDPSRKSLLDILNSMHDSHGIVVKMADSPTPAAQMPDAALIIIGPNASMFEKRPAPDLKTTTVPIIVSKDGHTDEIGMGTVMNTAAMYNTITIVKNDHPLAAGFPLGRLVVNTTTASQRMIRFSNLGPDAIKIAVGPSDNTTYSIVAYEKGGTMANGFKAPAKRVGLFWHRPAAATADGAKLVKAAVDWALRP
jgi:hypothetical protein